MIKFFTDIDNDIFSKLTDDHYLRKAQSNFLAYGNEYDFCRFFSVENDKQQAVICVFNSAMIVATISDFEMSDDFLYDIKTFIDIICPFTIELNVDIAKLLGEKLSYNYVSQQRTDFMFCKHKYSDSLVVNQQPSLDSVYDVLKDCFPDIKENYEMWMTDTSHRIRHSLSKAFLYGNHTTATLQYMINGKVLIGQVGTSPQYRGKHYARELLYYIGDKLSNEETQVHIFARTHRVSFYKEIGFTPVLTDLVFERKKDNG